ncbi:DNA-3-methyladenine glycosylase [candidate division KSB1 bacterium]|nr:DNA-3-methyladenine glycosylase [candidate division KSB1 bacterium]
MHIITREFYQRDAVLVARELLGKLLVRDLNGSLLSGMICETEAYLGEMDSASHAFRGKTTRNSVMFGPPGKAYIYLIYGKHYMFNIVTERENIPHAVLIRGILPVKGIKQMRLNRDSSTGNLTNGPGRLCRTMNINQSLNECDLTSGKDLWIEEYLCIPSKNILSGSRIGIEYAMQNDKVAHRRFWMRYED